jgi:hypothetical protein
MTSESDATVRRRAQIKKLYSQLSTVDEAINECFLALELRQGSVGVSDPLALPVIEKALWQGFVIRYARLFNGGSTVSSALSKFVEKANPLLHSHLILDRNTHFAHFGDSDLESVVFGSDNSITVLKCERPTKYKFDEVLRHLQRVKVHLTEHINEQVVRLNKKMHQERHARRSVTTTETVNGQESN